MTKFYIATGLARMRDHNLVRDTLVENGHELTYDWTQHGSVKNTSVQRLAEIAHQETNGVLTADVVIVLLPGGFGTHTELGLALGAGKKIILHSTNSDVFTACEKTCAFYHHPAIHPLVSDIEDTTSFVHALAIATKRRNGLAHTDENIEPSIRNCPPGSLQSADF